MKKLLVLSICLIFLLACTKSSNTNSAKDDTNYPMKEYLELKSNDVRFKVNSPETIIDKLENKKKGVYFIGFSDCPWCQSLVPVLNDLLIKNNKHSYYLDVNSKDFSDNQDLSDRLAKFDDSLADKKSNGSVPFVISINDKGEIKTHLGTLSDHDAYKEKLNKKQRTVLLGLLDKLIK